MTQLVWIVTGCATGFGRELVHAILARGDKCIATARKASDRLEAQKAAGAAILDLDVTAPQDELNKKMEDAIKIYGKIDVLVNNAGYIEAGFLEEIGYVLLNSTGTFSYEPLANGVVETREPKMSSRQTFSEP